MLTTVDVITKSVGNYYIIVIAIMIVKVVFVNC